jgi:hypothetical protein
MKRLNDARSGTQIENVFALLRCCKKSRMYLLANLQPIWVSAVLKWHVLQNVYQVWCEYGVTIARSSTQSQFRKPKMARVYATFLQLLL